MRRIGHPALAGGLALALGWCAPAAADVYWANEADGTIGRASADGARVDRSLVAGAAGPRAVAVDGKYVYWAHGDAAGRIGRARRNGSSVDHGFIAVGARPAGIAVANTGLYWTHVFMGAGQVGRAALDGSRLAPAFAPIRGVPCGVAVDADKVYWANRASSASLGRSHGQFDRNQGFVRGLGDPCGVAVTDTHVYWADLAGDAIGRARLDGTGVQRRFIATPRPCGVAVDDEHVYWSTGRGTIARASLRGTHVEPRWIPGARGPCGVAVDPAVRAVPDSHRFRRPGAIRAFLLANPSSSPLEVTAIRVVGRDRGDFAKSGDGCTVNVVPAGGACVFNLRFLHASGTGSRARVRVTSNATGSPLHIPLSGVG